MPIEIKPMAFPEASELQTLPGEWREALFYPNPPSFLVAVGIPQLSGGQTDLLELVAKP